MAINICKRITDSHFTICLLGLRVILSSFCAVINGIDLSFNAYSVQMKETFNFTQTQECSGKFMKSSSLHIPIYALICVAELVEVVASMVSVGFGVSFLEVLLTSAFGYIATFVITWITLPLSSGLYGLAAVHSDFMHSRPVWVYCIQLFMSVSNIITLTMMRNVVVGILPKKFVGTILGVFGAAMCLGKIVYSGLLEWICHNDLAKFFFTVSIVSGVFLSSFYPLLYPAARELERERNKESQEERRRGEEWQEDSHREKHTKDTKLHEMCQETESHEKSCLLEYTRENVPLKNILRCRFFHMTFWTTAVFSSAAYTILNNITSITYSIGINESFNIVTTMSMCAIITRVLYGWLFDKGASQAFAFWLLFSMYFTFAVGLTLGLWFLNPTTVYVVGVLCGIAVGPSNALPMAMLVHKYGRANLNPIYVALYFTLAASQILIQILTGYLYDNNVVTGTTCHGARCFYWSFLSLLCLTVVIAILQSINYVLTIHKCQKA